MFFHFKIIIKGVKKNLLRSFLTILQIAIGMAIFVAFINLGFQMNANIKDNFYEDELILDFNYKYYNDLEDDSAEEQNFIWLPHDKYEKLKELGKFPFCSIWKRPFAVPITIQKQNYYIYSLNYVDVDFPYIFELDLVEGAFFSSEVVDCGKPNILLEVGLAENIFGNAEEAMGQKIYIKSNPANTEQDEFVVTGVYRNTKESNPSSRYFFDALVPWTSTPKVLPIHFGEPFVFTLPDGMNYLDAKMFLANEFGINERHIEITAAKYSLRNHLNIAKESTRSLGIFSCVALIVVAIGTLSINIVNTAEKNRDIGLKRALGATKRSIVCHVLFESAVHSFMGSILGLVFGYFVQFAFMKGSQLPYAVSYDAKKFIRIETALISVVMAILIGIVFSLFPAWQAANLPPTEALKEE